MTYLNVSLFINNDRQIIFLGIYNFEAVFQEMVNQYSTEIRVLLQCGVMFHLNCLLFMVKLVKAPLNSATSRKNANRFGRKAIRWE